MKRQVLEQVLTDMLPAAFGRLCVETTAMTAEELNQYQPPSGGCVLKLGEVGVSGA